MMPLFLMGALTALALALALCILRLVKGPHSVDRILCLDLAALIVAGILVVHSVQTHQEAFIDIVLILSIISFIGTIVFARFIEGARR